MDARLQKRVQRYGWDKAAAYYEHSWKTQLAPAQQALIEMAQLAPGQRVIDVACGTGLVTFEAALRVAPLGQVVGTDISQEMVATAREAAFTRRTGNIVFDRMDAEALAFPDGIFTTALNALGLMYTPDPENAVVEMHRVLRPGGRAVCAVWGERAKCGWAELFPIVDSRVQSEVCPLFFRLGTGPSLANAFEAAGFEAIEVQRIETQLRFADDDIACEAAFLGGPVALACSRFSAETRAAAHTEYLDSIAPYRRAHGYDVPGEFVIVTGLKK